MQWATPSISSKRATLCGGGSSKPKRLITPSTSMARMGRSIVTARRPLPAVVREGLVGLGHAVNVVLALPGRPLLLSGVDDLGGEAVGHRVLAAVPRVVDQPAHGERAGPPGRNL